jgi:hypothetical protein
MFKVKWTGKPNMLCRGEWVILKDGKDVSSFIPDNKRYWEMGTAGTYQAWSIGYSDTYHPYTVEYQDGFGCEDWIDINFDWLEDICSSKEEMEELYHAIQENDWREGSCGGCFYGYN